MLARIGTAVYALLITEPCHSLPYELREVDRPDSTPLDVGEVGRVVNERLAQYCLAVEPGSDEVSIPQVDRCEDGPLIR